MITLRGCYADWEPRWLPLIGFSALTCCAVFASVPKKLTGATAISKRPTQTSVTKTQPDLLNRPARPSPAEPTNLLHGLAWQIALEREGFSPGILDGRIGSKTRAAFVEFQTSRRLPAKGQLDAATAMALPVAEESATTPYIVTDDDADRIAPLPKTWKAKSQAAWLGYESVLEAVAERFHCSRKLLSELNPGTDLTRLKPSDRIMVPNVMADSSPKSAHGLEVDLAAKQIRAIDADGNTMGLFHCSVAAKESQLPSGNARVQTISHDPTYMFDPKMWPEVKDVREKLLIPPGPRNPVGRCWIGLSLPGYGIHGTPNPELIGKTGSHGCIRLTNWDAIRLSRMISVGTPVRFRCHPGGSRPASNK